MKNDTVQRRFKIMLKELGLSQKEFSNQTGIQESDVSYYINGHRHPSAMALIKIANATHVSPSWILGFGSDEIMERM